ncbi:MAG TPA: TraR/DksA family transcriptional regulator [Mycobacteriales bacterium]|jgi:RNA polymerase-binding transcription factor DksA|nr:TraR/DksA family transcriptional regulator [Mycobacteriales bacterium]
MDESWAHELLRAERAATLERIRSMSGDFDGIVAASADTNADDEHDPEGPTIAFERAQVAALLAQARAYLDDIDVAAARLADGTYPVCERCGEPIGTERLAARPAVRTCVRCAASAHRT